VPRKGEPRRGQPRDAVGPPTGNYVAPPPSGTVEGPQRGVELGGLAITFPELTIGLPKLRFTGCSHFQRGGRMQLDSGVAPYVENPYAAYQAAVAQRSAEETEEDDTTRRSAEETDDDPTTKRTARPRCDQPARTATEQETCERLDRLEECIRQQNEAILRCIQQIKQSPGGTLQPAVPMPPAEEVPAPQKMGKLYPHWPNPQDAGQAPALIRPAGYLQPIPAAPLTERLPPITEES
jgi:hypothetical protein